ncbi:hypothetical protein CCU68_28300 [Pseudomonas gingeri NCPPB 3146 = LMG 5327]|uniref:Uncharacterized protein n=2 Tax=Pseudomonas gingeri TaxID=117681 RepID=A0A7Y8CBB7_9PSED|nr:hypothetical protein [Pseudomonas gingeri]NWC12448.1 hypothetical protein [Pseudomonas gingeri]PNQ89203.1 hypothetical protein CCU68_28300 [Pseudomonas gingeri NCPPB 3146 = LMG 5327]
MPPSAANISTMNRLAREVNDLIKTNARLNEKIVTLQGKINQRTLALHRATSESTKRSELNMINQYNREIDQCRVQQARNVTQIETKKAEYYRLESR